MRTIGGKRRFRLPDLDLIYRQFLLNTVIVDQAGDRLGGRIGVKKKHRFAQFLQWFYERVIPPEEHLVVDCLIDPILDDPLEVVKLEEDVTPVQLLTSQVDLHLPIVSMRVHAGAIVIHQPVAVTEMDFLANVVHI
jgi:hypothetical protein